LLLLSTLVLFIWIYLFFAHGQFWRPIYLPQANQSTAKRVAIIVPARNEAEVVTQCVSALLAQQYAGEFRIFLVDDNSSDGTADIARAAAEMKFPGAMTSRRQYSDRLQIVSGSPLPNGWAGKVWAMQQGYEATRAFHPDYVLLTDADILHEPQSLTRLVAYAEAQQLDLTSQMVRLYCQSTAERLLIPAFVYFFFLIYVPRWIANARKSTAGAAGGCVLLRSEALDRAGGFVSLADEIIDDCALAQRVKAAGGKLWLGLADNTRSIRPYGGFAGIRDMIARTAFNQLQHSLLLLAGCIVGMALTFLLPIVLIFVAHGAAAVAAIWACILMFASYAPLVRYFGLSRAQALTLPLAACFYLYATFVSATRYMSGRGGAWKDRHQDAKRENARDRL
jgi:hopene-associated glycosyltransferase HpnB